MHLVLAALAISTGADVVPHPLQTRTGTTIELVVDTTLVAKCAAVASSSFEDTAVVGSLIAVLAVMLCLAGALGFCAGRASAHGRATRQPAAKRTVGTQSQGTYTCLRGAATPRCVPPAEDAHGASL